MRLAENALAKEIWPRPSVTRMLGNLISNCLLQRQFRAGGPLVTANMTKIATTHVVLEKKIGEGAFGAVYSGGWRAAAGYAGAADTTSKLTAANAADGGEDEQFNATPAIDGNRLYLRSTKAVYCVSESVSYTHLTLPTILLV